MHRIPRPALPCLMLAVLASLLSPRARTADPEFDATRGVWHMLLESDHQAGPTRVDILLPDPLGPGPYPVLYILPVEGHAQTHYGDGIAEAKKADLANKYGIICVYPSFTKVPWYGDHPTDPTVRQESFILKDLVPWVDAQYPTRKEPDGRWLLGFSKSGWGACTLFFRHRDTFGYAAAWDVPFMLDGSGKDWGPMGIKHVIGTPENLPGYLPTALAKAAAAALAGQPPRLVIGSGEAWKRQCDDYHALLTQLDIPHLWRDDLIRKHHWDSGWLPPLAADLARIAQPPAKD